VNTGHFKYRGEADGAQQTLSRISPSLLHPLNALRLLYNNQDKIERNL
jgi:hypothetical protein